MNTTPEDKTMTKASMELLAYLIDIAAERDYCPLMPGDLTPEQRGNLTDLKAKGLIGASWEDDGCTWVEITDEARAALNAAIARAEGGTDV